MMAEETTDSTAGQSGGSILTRKTGPLANWIWMALLLLVALAYSMWKRNSQAAPVEGPEVDVVPGDQTAPPIFILPQNPQPTVPINIYPPGTTPPSAPPSAVKPVVTKPPTTPTAPPKPATNTHWVVTVDTYTKDNTKWNSTLWGIAAHSGYGKASTNWKSIWDDPRNAQIKALRKDPTKIRKGDKIYVKKK